MKADGENLLKNIFHVPIQNKSAYHFRVVVIVIKCINTYSHLAHVIEFVTLERLELWNIKNSLLSRNLHGKK